ncbi:MAG: nucleotide-binding universal stress UspA family protein [Vicingaceae bacterium]|jgi:nucleotide-binding universal stress UspA family protein
MNKILIPTDFSLNAKKATDYALLLFDEKDTEITLVNTFYIPYAAPDVIYSINDVSAENANSLFKVEQERIATKFPNLKATIITEFTIGDIVNVVCAKEKKGECDLVVMGTKGASGLAEVFVGSRTSSMIKSIKTPVLVIPAEATLNLPKRILFAADENVIDRKLDLDILKKIANKNKSKIDALYISENDENKEVIKKFIDYEVNLNFVNIPHELKMEDGDNVEEAINQYVEKHPIDLVAMITTKGNLFHNLFHGSVTKRVVMHTKMPLLVMHTNLKND